MFGVAPAPSPASTDNPRLKTTEANDTVATTAAPAPGPAVVESDNLPDDMPLRAIAAFDRLAEEHNDILTIGGQFYLRYDYYLLEQGDWANFKTDSPNLLDVYFDARPNDRLRAYARGRLAYDFTIASGSTNAYGVIQTQTQALLDQMWLKFDIARAVFVTFGRQPLRWGAGRFWNPTDFLNPIKRDPLAIFDQRVGINLLKIHVPIESQGSNYYVLAALQNAATPRQIAGAARAEILIDQTEIIVTVADQDNGPLQLGLDVSSGVGLFDLRLEAALSHNVTTPFFRGAFDATAGILPEQYSRANEWIAQLTAGAEIALRYTDDDTVALGAEYFYNGLGYDSANLLPILAAQQLYKPLYFGKHYAAAYAQLAKPGTWDNTTFILSILGNLSDRSFMGRLDYIIRVLTFMDFNAYATYHFGDVGELHYSVVIPVGAIAYPQGVTVTAPRMDVGVGARLYF